MAFNLADVLKDVSESGTGREQIEYIKLDLIDEDPNNFYQLSGIEELAANIELCGLQQPIRVRPVPGKSERYVIVSGHRRRKAVEILARDNPERWSEVPCIVEDDAASPALQQLRLIYANSNTRTMTPAEVSEQAVQVEKLLYQLKEEGYEFPGRMRDHVAEAVGASKSKLARLKVIRENLAPCWRPSFKSSKLAESTAYALAQMPDNWQQMIFDVHGKNPNQVYEGSVKEYMNRFAAISKIKCRPSDGGTCINQDVMMEKSCKDRWNDPCRSGCCMDCFSLPNCKSSCQRSAVKKKEMKDTTKEANRRAEQDRIKREKPMLDFIRDVYKRVGIARKSGCVSVEALFQAQEKIYNASVDDPKQEAMENGSASINVNTTLPFGYSMYAATGMKLCKVADALGCSIDYLLGRSEDLRPSGEWQTGTPWNLGQYAVIVRWSAGGKRSVQKMEWDGQNWKQRGYVIEICDGIEILSWIELPEEE